MKQLGNLAIVCALRRDTLLQVLDGTVTVHVVRGPDRTVLCADWHDDEKITQYILELNHGRFREDNTEKGVVAA